MSKTLDKLKGAERERIALFRLRPARRGLWITALGLALIVAGAYLAIAPRQPRLDLQPISDEPLQLKLEFAFPAARR